MHIFLDVFQVYFFEGAISGGDEISVGLFGFFHFYFLGFVLGVDVKLSKILYNLMFGTTFLKNRAFLSISLQGHDFWLMFFQVSFGYLRATGTLGLIKLGVTFHGVFPLLGLGGGPGPRVASCDIH